MTPRTAPGAGPVPASAVIIGTGMMGTSIGLALRGQGTLVWLSDADQAAARLAAELGAGRVLPAGGPPGGPAEVAILAMPPAALASALAGAQRARLATWYTDVASVKELPVRQAEELGCDLVSYVPGHPMAGRERSGPVAARADLFAGQAWAICPGPRTSPDGVAVISDLARACGASPTQMSAWEHDRWVALVSHVPHLVAGAMAAQCEGAPGPALALAGQGLRDVTRIAAGDPALWTEILSANAAPVNEILAEVADRLAVTARILAEVAEGDAESRNVLTGVLEAAKAGTGKIPGKHRGPAQEYAIVQVVIGDRPGELARLFAAAGAAGINIEDIRIEHSPELPSGVAELSVGPEAAGWLAKALEEGGWPVASPRD